MITKKAEIRELKRKVRDLGLTTDQLYQQVNRLTNKSSKLEAYLGIYEGYVKPTK